MKFVQTVLEGVYIIEPEFHEDERGFFARILCEKEFEAHGLYTSFVQCSISFNRRKGTLRGMHYQMAPHAECKLVRCTMGAIYDVILDPRRDSATFGRWLGIELNAENRRTVFIPQGFAHGFQTLVDNTEVFYQMSEFYHPECARGVRWNDPVFAIEWPLTVMVISGKDRSYTLWESAE